MVALTGARRLRHTQYAEDGRDRTPTSTPAARLPFPASAFQPVPKISCTESRTIIAFMSLGPIPSSGVSWPLVARFFTTSTPLERRHLRLIRHRKSEHGIRLPPHHRG